MESTDIDVLRAVFAAFAKRDVETVLSRAADYFRDVRLVWDQITVTPTRFRQVGDTILVTGKDQRGRAGPDHHRLDRLDLAGARRQDRLRTGHASAGAAIEALASGGA